MNRRTPVVFVILVLAGHCFSAGVLGDQSEQPKEDDYELYKLFVDTLDQVERNYVKKVSRRELIEAAIRGVVRDLDPYSAYIGPDQLDGFRTTVQGNFGGVGIQIGLKHGRPQVLSPLVGTPAYEAGILAGDRIVEIDGKSTKGITIEETVRRLKGEPGTDVTLTVLHPGGSEPLQVPITRRVIHVKTVLGDHRKPDDHWDYMLDPERQIAYVRVTAFSRETARELRKALDELKEQDLRALILDLRFNPGGLLRSAIDCSDLFLSAGKIVSTSGRSAPERSWEAKKDGTFEGFDMVVLVNRYSASASEIVAACLQDHQRAVIMGERTWGKGSVQNVIPLEHDHSALKLTTASYVRPSGKNIHRFPDAEEDEDWGVAPDDGYALKLTDAQMIALVTDRRRRDVVRPKDREATDTASTTDTAQSADSDRPAPKRDAADQQSPPPGKQSETETSKPEQGADKPQEKPKPGGQPPPTQAKEAASQAKEPPSEPKPASKPAEDQSEEPDEAKAGDEPAERTPLVDPQLQMAIDYLTAELARAD